MLTPRKFDSQLKVYHDIEAAKYGVRPDTTPKQPTGFIDQIPGW